MQVCVPNMLADAWDASDSFAEAFLSTYEAVTLAYDAARERGVEIDANVDENLAPSGGTPSTELQKALARGEGVKGAVALAAEYGVCRQTVARIAADMNVTVAIPRHKEESRRFCEQCFRDGETRPRVIIAALEAEGLPTVKRNTITQWRIRFERLQKP